MKRPERTEREAAALRANLLKRKDQARRRAGADEATVDEAAPPEGEDEKSSFDREEEERPRVRESFRK